MLKTMERRYLKGVLKWSPFTTYQTGKYHDSIIYTLDHSIAIVKLTVTKLLKICYGSLQVTYSCICTYKCHMHT